MLLLKTATYARQCHMSDRAPRTMGAPLSLKNVFDGPARISIVLRFKRYRSHATARHYLYLGTSTLPLNSTYISLNGTYEPTIANGDIDISELVPPVVIRSSHPSTCDVFWFITRQTPNRDKNHYFSTFLAYPKTNATRMNLPPTRRQRLHMDAAQYRPSCFFAFGLSPSY